jgi:hypothetical protein
VVLKQTIRPEASPATRLAATHLLPEVIRVAGLFLIKFQYSQKNAKREKNCTLANELLHSPAELASLETDTYQPRDGSNNVVWNDNSVA